MILWARYRFEVASEFRKDARKYGTTYVRWSRQLPRKLQSRRYFVGETLVGMIERKAFYAHLRGGVDLIYRRLGVERCLVRTDTYAANDAVFVCYGKLLSEAHPHHPCVGRVIHRNGVVHPVLFQP